jgi:hypothetical protein
MAARELRAGLHPTLYRKTLAREEARERGFVIHPSMG